MTRMGRVVNFGKTLDNRKVVCIFDEEADTVLELARRLASEWSDGFEHSRCNGNKASRCTSGKKCGGGGCCSRWSCPCMAAVRFDECAHIWEHMAQIWEQGRNLERGVYIRGKESGIGRFVPSQVAKPPFPEGLLSDTSLELRQGKESCWLILAGTASIAAS